MEGIITSVEDHGTIVIVWAQNRHDHREFPVRFDHRAFGSFLGDHGEEPNDLIGIGITFDGTAVTVDGE